MDFRETLVFEPIAMERIWGGRSLESVFGRNLPPGVPIGESWELVDREDAQSVVHTGALRGTTLNDLWTKHRDTIFGEAYKGSTAPRFPILIKLLDARERLSVQVHPPAAVAPTLKGEPKTEMWYFAGTQPGAKIYAGLKKGVTREKFDELLQSGQVEEALHTIPVEKGDYIFIPSGRLHAIGEGNIIVEIQQNSDTTYRVFDWNRVGLDGKARKLHLGESLLSTDFDDFEPVASHSTEGVLVECPHFRVEKLKLADPVPAITDKRFAVFTVLSGSLTCAGATYKQGDFFLVPATLDGETLVPKENGTEVLRSTLPV